MKELVLQYADGFYAEDESGLLVVDEFASEEAARMVVHHFNSYEKLLDAVRHIRNLSSEIDGSDAGNFQYRKYAQSTVREALMEVLE